MAAAVISQVVVGAGGGLPLPAAVFRLGQPGYLVGFVVLLVLAVLAVLLADLQKSRRRASLQGVSLPVPTPSVRTGFTLVGSPLLTSILGVGLLFSLLALVPRISGFRLPGIQTGYEPSQPIAFSHRLHAGEMQVPCLYCHSGAEKSRHAGIPPANVCMNCHKFVTAPVGAIRAEEEQAQKEKREPQRIVSPELQKLYDAQGLNASLKPDPGKPARSIQWAKVHNVPDFAYFDHRAHVNAGVACQRCHGPVETMERVRQVEDLTMGWCVNCHRDVNQKGLDGKRVYASIDCATCHY